jgi:hypothetical protein
VQPYRVGWRAPVGRFLQVAARIRKFYDERARERQRQRSDLKGNIQASLPESGCQARDAAGKAVGVSGRSVDYATSFNLAGPATN